MAGMTETREDTCAGATVEFPEAPSRDPLRKRPVGAIRIRGVIMSAVAEDGMVEAALLREVSGRTHEIELDETGLRLARVMAGRMVEAYVRLSLVCTPQRRRSWLSVLDFAPTG